MPEFRPSPLSMHDHSFTAPPHKSIGQPVEGIDPVRKIEPPFDHRTGLSLHRLHSSRLTTDETDHETHGDDDHMVRDGSNHLPSPLRQIRTPLAAFFSILPKLIGETQPYKSAESHCSSHPATGLTKDPLTGQARSPPARVAELGARLRRSYGEPAGSTPRVA